MSLGIDDRGLGEFSLESEELRFFLRSTRLGLWEWRLPHMEGWESPEAGPMFGHASGFQHGSLENWASDIHPEDRQRAREALQRAIVENTFYDSTYRVVWPGGETHWIHAQGKLIAAPDEQPSKMVGWFEDVTERELLERDRALLASAVESSEDAFVTEDAGGNIVTWNKAAERIFGFAANEIVGHSVTTLIPPERGEEKERFLEAIRRGERIDRFETERIRKDGSRVPVSVSLSPVRTREGRVIGTSVVVRDISGSKKTEAALRRSEERLRAVITTAVEGIISIDEQGTILSVNPAAVRIFGYAADEMIGQNVKILMPEPDRSRHDQYLENYRRTGAARIIGIGREVMGLRKGGSLFPLELAVSESRVAGERFFTGTVKDISQRKAAEKALRVSEARFRQLAESMPQIVWTARANGVINYFNQRWYKFTRSSPGTIGEQSWDSILHPEDLPALVEQWNHSVKTGEPLDHEARFLEPPTRRYRWFVIRAVPVRNEKGEVAKWFGTCTDIDDLKWAQQELTEARNLLAEAYRKSEQTVRERTARLEEMLAELQHVSYSITHDMRAPLRAMSGFAQIVIEERAANLDPVHRDYLRRIAAAADRMDQLIEDALSYTTAVQEELPVHPVDARRLLREMLETYPAFDPARTKIELADNIPTVLGNVAGMTQCFSNLLNNAIKFAKPGIKPEIRVWADNEGEFVRLWFEDNGIGIAPEHLPGLFGMFVRVSHQTEGTGIGLALVRKVMERMGGRVGVESEPGKGSRFWLEFKRVPGG